MQHHANAPQEFICPLTLELMVIPVVNRQGNCYEKAALVEWLSQPNATCPLTRQPIRLSDFIQDVKLQRKIMQWRIIHGEDPDEISQELTESTTDDVSFGYFVRAPSLLTEQPRVVAQRRRKNFLRRWKPNFFAKSNRA